MLCANNSLKFKRGLVFFLKKHVLIRINKIVFFSNFGLSISANSSNKHIQLLCLNEKQMITEIFIYSNYYYYNFGFNVTCILNKKKEYSKTHANVLKVPSHEWTSLTHKRQPYAKMQSYFWEKAIGVGVVLGFDNLRALDVDNCADVSIVGDFLHILNLSPNYKWVIKSGSRNGFHILFYANNHEYTVAKNKIKAFLPKQNSNLFKHIELRWTGHLVLPPSIHTSLHNYEFINGLPLEKPNHINLENLNALLFKYCSNEALIDNDRENNNDIVDANFYVIEDPMANPINQVAVHEESMELFDLLNTAQRGTVKCSNYNADKIKGSCIDKDADGSNIISSSLEKYKEPYYLFFDTETTSTPNDWNVTISNLDNWPRLVKLSWLLYDSEGELVLKNEAIIKPNGFSIPIGASEVHGITTDYALKHGEDLRNVLLNFEEQCTKSTFLIAHNINFDSELIDSEFSRNFSSNPISKLELLSTMECSTEFCKIKGNYGYKWPKLSELHLKLFGVDLEETHEALADIKATARCFFEMRKLNLV
jgi:DNA polymerase-3 subunit epsilon